MFELKIEKVFLIIHLPSYPPDATFDVYDSEAEARKFMPAHSSIATIRWVSPEVLVSLNYWKAERKRWVLGMLLKFLILGRLGDVIHEVPSYQRCKEMNTLDCKCRCAGGEKCRGKGQRKMEGKGLVKNRNEMPTQKMNKSLVNSFY